jgi:hypothetical protein
MPSYAGQLNEEEIMQLIAYLKSIGNQTPEQIGATEPSRLPTNEKRDGD